MKFIFSFIFLISHNSFADCAALLSQNKIIVSNLEHADVSEAIQIEKRAWGELSTNEKNLQSRVSVFPQGQFVARDNKGRVIGFLNSQRMDENVFHNLENAEVNYKWVTLTLNGTINHSANGNTLFLMNLTTNIEGSNKRKDIGASLIQAALDYAKKNNIKRVYGVTRLNGFLEFCKKRFRSEDERDLILENMSLYKKYIGAEIVSYISLIYAGSLIDPSMSFHLSQGAQPVVLVPNAMPDDIDSLGYGVLIRYTVP